MTDWIHPFDRNRWLDWKIDVRDGGIVGSFSGDHWIDPHNIPIFVNQGAAGISFVDTRLCLKYVFTWDVPIIFY